MAVVPKYYALIEADGEISVYRRSDNDLLGYADRDFKLAQFFGGDKLFNAKLFIKVLEDREGARKDTAKKNKVSEISE